MIYVADCEVEAAQHNDEIHHIAGIYID